MAKDKPKVLKIRLENNAVVEIPDGKKEFASMRYWANCKNEMARLIKSGGKAICFGWSSMGLGKSRGFELERILLVPHGGSKNDTIVTVEVKSNSNSS